jgi:lysophospholipase L1-like esterase
MTRRTKDFSRFGIVQWASLAGAARDTKPGTDLDPIRGISMRTSAPWRHFALSVVLTAALVIRVTHAEPASADSAAPATQPQQLPPYDPTIDRPRSAKWIKLHEACLQEASKGPYDVIFLGDSITDNWHTKGSDIFQQCYAPLHTLNLGVGGDHTENVLWRLHHGEVAGLNPKVIVLMIGTNNYRNEVPDIVRGVTAVVKDLRDKMRDARILLLGIFPRGQLPTDPLRAKLAEVNTQIAKLDDGDHIKYLDIGKAFLNDNGVITQQVMGDFLHPTAYGYVLWAKAMNPTLAELLGDKIAEPTLSATDKPAKLNAPK